MESWEFSAFPTSVHFRDKYESAKNLCFYFKQNRKQSLKLQV